MTKHGISIIGSGWVGTAVGRGFIKLGNNVVFYDVINKELPNFTIDLDYAIANSDVSFICVPTPTTNARIDLSYLESAVEAVGKAISKNDDGTYHIVVIKSTVVPLTTNNVVIPLLETASGKSVSDDEIGVCANPEFLTAISHSWNNNDKDTQERTFFSEDRIVIGDSSERAGDTLERLYRPLNIPIFRTNLRTAELIKYASNCMLATKISFWNEMFSLCNQLGIDSKVVANIVSKDTRIGKYGSIHGKAFGGTCLPKDLEAFIAFAEGYIEIRLLKAAHDINVGMREKYGIRE